MNSLPMFTSIDQTICFRAAVPLENRNADSLYDALNKVFCHLNRAGFLIKYVHCNHEFKPLMEKIDDE